MQPSRSWTRALALLVAVATLGTLGTAAAIAASPSPAANLAPTPDDPSCTRAALRETVQGRVPLADYASGRAARGYACNATQVSHVGSEANGTGASGGFRVYRYVDAKGQVCAFYDSTLLFPANAQVLAHNATNATNELPGVWVLDMTHPAHPVHTATLSTPAMLTPHESLSLNVKRGLLGAVMGNPLTAPGQFDLYEVRQDCRHPVLASTLPVGALGHEGSFSPDGRTYYASSTAGHTLTAIDVSNPALPVIVWSSLNWMVHGLNVSDDGNTLYFADLGREGIDLPQAGSATEGLTVLDVSQIQKRVANPQVKVISHLTWSIVSIPQTALPITEGGHPYLVEVDEYAIGNSVGAARIIDIADARHPQVVSNMRLAVDNAAHRNDGSQQNDPNATNPLQGYAGHYCAVPQRTDPKIVACSFILSGLRVFDISNLQHPVEIAYFNRPATVTEAGTIVVAGPQGAYAMSQPAFDVANHQIWYSDGNSGFYAVQIDPKVWP